MATIAELRAEQEQVLSEARARFDEIDSNTDEARAAELESQYDAAMAKYDALGKRAQRTEEMEAREAEMEARAAQGDSRRPTGADVSTEDTRSEDEQDAGELYAKAFRTYVADGMGELSGEQRKALREARAQSVGTDAKGGYLVPTGFVPEMVKSMAAYSPMFDEAVTRQLVTASGNTLEMPTVDDTANEAVLVAEATDPGETDVDVGVTSVGAFKYSSKVVKISSELLQDAEVDPVALVREALSERFSRGIGKALTVGTGSAQPQGIVTFSATGVTASAAAAVTFDELIDLQHSIDPAYRSAPNVGFMFHDKVLQMLRKVKDNDGNYIWSPANAQTGAPALILGNRFRINQAMATPAAGAKTIVYGDFSKYLVRRVREVSIRRLDERYAETDQTAFVGFARVDGRGLDSGAIKHLAQSS